MPRIPWSQIEDEVIADAVAGKLALIVMIERLSHRPFRALRNRFVTHGNPDPRTMVARKMAFGSAALLNAILAAYKARKVG